MSHVTEIQSNNADLQSILDMVNALPSGSALGNATAADVVAGKTFSSASGVKVTGTLVPMELLTGTVKGTGSTTIPSGATGSMVSGLPKGKKNIFITAMSSGASQSYLYHLLMLDGVVFSYSTYRHNHYVYENGGYEVIQLDSVNGVLSAADTSFFYKGLSYKYFMW